MDAKIIVYNVLSVMFEQNLLPEIVESKNLFSDKFFDSYNIVEFISGVEHNANINIRIEDIVIENFGSFNSIVTYLKDNYEQFR